MKMKQEILGNAPWRIDSEEEKELAVKADFDLNARKQYVEYYLENEPEYHKNGLVMINTAIDQFRGKNISNEKRKNYIMDMIYSLHRFGCMYDEYFLYNFEFLNSFGRDSFITDKNRWDYYFKLNGRKFHGLFTNKAQMNIKFRRYYYRDFLSVESAKDYDSFCAFRKKHSSFILKPTNGSGGKGVRLVDTRGQDDQIAFKQILTAIPVVLEEIVKQHPKMKALHPDSLNTLRITTIRCADGNVKVFYPRLRVGVGNSVVDNAASGGILLALEAKTGIVIQEGVDKTGRRYFRHPDTNIVFPGFKVPAWEEAIAFVKELAEVVPECRYIGWDCALTENGWCMIEANHYGQFGIQYVLNRGLKKELDEIIIEMCN